MFLATLSAKGGALPAECHGDRQTNIAETDDGKPSIVRHDGPLAPRCPGFTRLVRDTSSIHRVCRAFGWKHKTELRQVVVAVLDPEKDRVAQASFTAWMRALLVVRSSSARWRKRGASCARVMPDGRTVRSSQTTRHPIWRSSPMCVECGSRLSLWRRLPAAKRQSVSEHDQWPFHSTVIPTDLKSISWLMMPPGFNQRHVSA